MRKLLSTNGQVQYDHDEWIVDTPEDLDTIPPHSGMGSIVFVISTATLYMKNSEGEWVEV
jgi:hypothetical protein